MYARHVLKEIKQYDNERSQPMAKTSERYTGPLASPDFCNTTQCAEQLELRILRALNGTGCLPLREVTVHVEKACVSLSGCVPTYYMKQLAQSIVQNVDGVESVRNHLTVA